MIEHEKHFSPGDFSNAVLSRNGKLGADACLVLAQAINAVDPYRCVANHVQFDGQHVTIGGNVMKVDQFERIFLIGFGKAAVPMAVSLIDILEKRITQACVITKDPQFLSESGYWDKLTVLLGGHPIPTEESVEATQRMLNSLPALNAKDLVLIVVSGGGSALFTDPIEGISLEDLQKLTQLLLNCGADIHEINTIRKHLDQVKGGRLAVRLQPAQVDTLILSDVIGDSLDMIASGPTVPDLATYQDALDILRRLRIEDKVPHTILETLKNGKAGTIPETLKPGQLPQGRVRNHLVGTNYIAAEAALRCAKDLGYQSIILSGAVTGLTEQVAEWIEGVITRQLALGQLVNKPACLILGGETTVRVTGDGLGGRNMDLALRMVPKLRGMHGVLFVSLASDGEDGPTDAAGAAVDGSVFAEGEKLHQLDIAEYVRASNSYRYFEQVGGLIKTGATGTNVNDLMLVLIAN
jgi:hydroxypyruvate reductase